MIKAKPSQKKHNLDTKKVAFRAVYGLLWAVVALVVTGAFCMINTEDVLAEAKASTITLGIDESHLSVNVTPSIGGAFAASSDGTISVKTDNFTGYTLMIAAKNDSSRNLSDGNGHVISSLDSPVSASDFASSSSYNDRWGLKPSQYVLTSGNNTTIINNNEEDKYLPAPTVSGTTIATTITANASFNTYTYSFGARVSEDAVAGAYSGTFVVAAVPNNIIYNITFNKNASSDSTVTDIPVPQGATISGGTSTSVTLSSTIPKRVGYNFAGWCDVPTTNPEGVGPQVCPGNTYAAGASYGIDQTIDTTDIHLYAIWTPKTYTATFYYNQDSDSGETDIKTATATCTVANAAGTCQPTIPSVVTNSVGTYNNAYVGVANATGTMDSNTNVTISGDTTFYAVYRSNVTLYHPSSTSARTSKALYRNQYFTSTSAMSDTVLSASTTGTSNYTPSTPVSGYNIYGYATSASTNTKSFNDIPGMAANNGTTYYMILAKSITATFYYNNNTNDSPTSYTAAVTSTTASGNQYIRCTASAAEISNGNISVPTAVSNSKGTHGENYLNVGTSTDNMTGVTPTTGATTYYTRYSDTITIYRAASETTANGNLKYYRNQRVTGTATSNVSTAVLNTANTGTGNTTYSSAVSNYSLAGFNTATNTSSVTYNSVQTAAEASAVYSTLYAIETRSVTATFYYNNNTTPTSGTSSVASTTASGTRTLYTTSTTAATTSQGAINVPDAVTGSYGIYNTPYVGVATAVKSMTAATVNTANTTYYAFYRATVTMYKPSSTTEATSVTLYRNETLASTSAMHTTYLSSSQTGLSNYTYTAAVTDYTLYGFNTATNSASYMKTCGAAATANCTSIASLATSPHTTVYAIDKTTVPITFYYNSNTSDSPTSYTAAVTSTTVNGSRRIYTKSTTTAGISQRSVTVPDVVTNSKGTHGEGYLNVGTSTDNMTAVSPTAKYTTYYARYSDEVTVYKPSSESATTSTTWYRNQRVTGTTASSLSTAVLATENTTISNSSYSSAVSDYNLYGFATSTNTATRTYTSVQNAAEANAVYGALYAIETRSITATFYYNNMTASNCTTGTSSVASTTANGTRTLYTTSTSASTTLQGAISIPSAVSSSAGTYCNAYAGVNTTGGMLSSSVSPTTGSDKYYAFYRTNVTVVSPSSTSAAGTATRYRNQYVTSDSTSAMSTTVLSDSITGTGNYTQTAKVGDYSFSRFANAASRNSNDYGTSVSALAATTATKAYAVYRISKSITFYYNNNTNDTPTSSTTPALGTAAVTSTTATAYQYLRPTSDSTAGTNNPSVTVPTAVSGSKGTHGENYLNVGTATDTMAAVTPTYANNTYYARYSDAITIYKPSSESATTSATWHRNQRVTGTAAANISTAVLATANTTITNDAYTSAVSNYSLKGFATSTNTSTTAYNSVQTAAEANAVYDTLYAVETRSVTATFYYNNRAASDCTAGTSSVTSTTSSGTRTLYTTSTTAATTAQGSIAIPSAVSSSAGTYCNAYAGVNTSAAMRASSVSPTTANTTYYAFYRTNVTIVTPSSTSAAGTATRYRNQYVSSTSAMSTTVLSDSNTGTSNYTQTATVATNYNLYGFANAASRNNKDYADVAAIAASTATKAWAVYSRTNTGTFYYQSNTTAGSTTISSKTATATQYLRPTSDSASGFGNTNYTIPADVKDTTKSMGTYNNTYVGVATSTGTMNSSTTASTSGDSGTNTFYAVYRTSVTLYYPSSTSARTSKTLYRNQWFTSTTAMATTVLSDSTTGTSNYAPSTPVTNYTITGYAASASTNTVGFANVAAMATDTGTTYYMILSKSVTATFYYNNNTTPTSGTSSVTSTTASANQFIRCTSSAAEISNSSISVPSAVSSSYGIYNTPYVGVATAVKSMTAATVNTANTTYYAFYRATVTMYKPSSTTEATSVTLYRNETLASTSAMHTTYLSSSQTGLSNYTYTAAVTDYTLYGFNTATNSVGYVKTCAAAATTNCTTIARLATSPHTTVYAIDKTTITATFYYNNNTNDTPTTSTTPTLGTAAVTSTTADGTRRIYTTSTSTSAINQGSITVPEAVTGSKGTHGENYLNVGTSTSNMTAVTPKTGSTTYYARYSDSVTNYYYDGSAYASRTLYRNQRVTGTATANVSDAVLATANTTTSNYSTAAGPGSSAFYGYATALSSTSRASNCGNNGTTACSSVANAAASTNATLNTIYRFTQNFSSTGSTGVTGIGSTVQYCYVSSTAASAGGTSCSVTTPTISVDTGYTSLGWGTQGHTSAGTAAGNSYTVSTSGGTLYANAKLSTYNLVITGDANVSAMSVKKGSTSGTTTTCSKSGTKFTCSALTYGTKYYLYPTFASGYEFSSWTKTDSATNASLGSTTTENTYYQMGAGAGAVTLASKVSSINLYNAVASMSKGTQTLAQLRAAITVPTSADRTQDTSNSGVYEYNASVFGTSSDAANTHKIYYYRGVLENSVGSYGSDGSAVTYPNYVKLGNTCWRIVRTTGSGGIKMIYNGTYGATTSGSCANATTNAQVTTSAFNGTDSTYYQIVRVGYTYNSTYAVNTSKSGTIAQIFGSNSNPGANNTRSDIKTYIEDTWYASNMTAYTSKLEASAGYCNDRTMNTTNSWTTPLAESTTIASTYGTSGLQAYYFGAYPRDANAAQSSSLTCGNKYSQIDRSTVDLYRYVPGSNGTSNQLKYPAALLTTDEAAFAGSGWSSSTTPYHANSFLRSGSIFWLLSPSNRPSNGYANGFFLRSSGSLDGGRVNYAYGVRPAISLKPGTMAVSGSGTATDPWIVDTSVSPNPYCTDASTCMQNTTNPPACGTTMVDGRDGATYTTATIAGTCWMTQNLRFTSGELKVGESDVTSDITMTYGQLSSGDSYTEPRIATGSTTDYGTYYNFCAASAKTVCSDSSSQTASQDICPAGWHLPTKAQLDTIASNKPSSFSSVRAGYYESGSLGYADSDGLWWGSTGYSATAQYRLAYNKYFNEWFVSDIYKYFGNSVRCVRAS